MPKSQRQWFPPLLALASSLVVLCATPPGNGLQGPSVARAASPTTSLNLPAHAFPRPGGYGWECVRGYRRVEDQCVRVHVPPHAFLDYFGHGWECVRGYRREGDLCIPVQVPAHAYLGITGDDWECERGYQREGERCLEVRVPPHAYLSYFGHDWECERGYRRAGDRCLEVQVPAPEVSPVASVSEDELVQLAIDVNNNREASHDRQTITHLQRQLQQAGYDAGPIDGLLGPRTRNALRQFLADRDLGSGTISRTTASPTPDS